MHNKTHANAFRVAPLPSPLYSHGRRGRRRRWRGSSSGGGGGGAGALAADGLRTAIHRGQTVAAPLSLPPLTPHPPPSLPPSLPPSDSLASSRSPYLSLSSSLPFSLPPHPPPPPPIPSSHPTSHSSLPPSGPLPPSLVGFKYHHLDELLQRGCLPFCWRRVQCGFLPYYREALQLHLAALDKLLHRHGLEVDVDTQAHHYHLKGSQGQVQLETEISREDFESK